MARVPSAERQRRLLLALLVLRDDLISIERLVEMVWPAGAPLPQDPVGTLRTYLTRLRRTLEPEHVGGTPGLLVGGPEWFQLRLEGHELDADRFEAELATANSMVDTDPHEALRRLEQGLSRWRGTALAEVAVDPWAQPEAVRLEELRLSARELRFRCLLETGRHDEALSDLERHVREHPLRERPHGQLLVALHRCGRTGEATETYRTFRDQLVEEMGLDPSGELEEMHRRLLEGRDPLEPDTDTGVGAWNELPEPRTPLIGREAHVREASDLLWSVRVVTLTGVGGVGKTRLALEVARAARERGSHVVFVDLSVVADQHDVVDAVFAALRLPADARGDQADGLVRMLRSRPALLVMDNCEHVLDAVASLADRLTRDCPDLRVLATSREAIDIDGEHIYHVPSLGLSAGVELFLSSAAAMASMREPGPDETAAVEEICRRLDGIPLAIELAAARTSHLAPAAIAERLDERFWLLAGSRRALGRHQTLQATVDWSYDLLGEEAQAVLRGTAVFVGGFDTDALAAVLERTDHDLLDHLRTLVGSSLVEVDHRGAQSRYRLLETIRLYAQDRLTEAREVEVRRRAHAHHFLARATSYPPRLDDLSPWATASTGTTELGNHLAALDWLDRHGALTDLGRLAARIPTVLGYTGFVDTEGRYLGREDVTAALDDLDERALYLVASAGNANYLGRYRDQLTYGEAALEIARDPVLRAAATDALANACTIFDPKRIPSLVDAALADLPTTATMIRQNLRMQPALGLIMQGNLQQAADCLAGVRDEGHGFAAAELVLVLYLLGEHQQALTVSRPSDINPQHAVWDYRWTLVRALTAITQRRPEAARRHLTDAAAQIRSSPQRLLDVDVLLGCAALAYHTEDHRRAAEILATFRGNVRTPASFAVYAHYRDLLKDQLSKPERTEILKRVAHLAPTEVLERELARRPPNEPSPQAFQQHQPDDLG